MIVGIDPGCTGAIVVLSDNGRYLDHMLMPTLKVGSKTRVNGAAVSAFLRPLLRDRNETHVYLEQVGPMPHQQASSMFTFGHAAGLVEGVVTGIGLPLTLVTPQAWKKAARLIGEDKDAARSRAIQLYPELRDLDAKGNGQAIADAILIARFGCGLSVSKTQTEESDSQ